MRNDQQARKAPGPSLEHGYGASRSLSLLPGSLFILLFRSDELQVSSSSLRRGRDGGGRGLLTLMLNA
jgi:hypothetical protein